MGIFTSEVDELIAEATSEYLPAAQEDIGKNLEICDLIKTRQVNARNTMRSIKARLQHRNPNVQLLALSLTDTCVKNAGPSFLREAASREFVDVLVGLCWDAAGPVARRAQELLQMWALLLNDQEGLQYVREAYEQAQREGVNFPPPPRNITTAIVKTEAPPEWKDNSNCVRCNVQFGIMQRKHHCRRCGLVFCQDCSGKSISLPELGLYEEVRVCERCFARKFGEQIGQRDQGGGISLPTRPPSEEEDEELARAIRLSLQDGQSIIPQSTKVADERVVKDDKNNGYDEDAALAAAIAASLDEVGPVNSEKEIIRPCIPTNSPQIHHHPSSNVKGEDSSPSDAATSSVKSPTMLITPIERENVQLFGELLLHMHRESEELEDPQFLQLAQSMVILRDRLQSAIANSRFAADIPRIIATLDAALLRYEDLATGGVERIEERSRLDERSFVGHAVPDWAAVPTRPRSQTGSIIHVVGNVKTPLEGNSSNLQISQTSNVPYRPPPPPPADVIPVLKPKPLNATVQLEELIPDIYAEDGKDEEDSRQSREDPLAELVDDAPLIQL